MLVLLGVRNQALRTQLMCFGHVADARAEGLYNIGEFHGRVQPPPTRLPALDTSAGNS